eukprot:TRINITY_DN6676_c0_g1_i2.p1 TRINITY_DN6676_c0_g1~~TRINITY_DN6676_c0_g1_i2.p1  ORF type:complete len:155 (+),score=31.53 TRINITY_DN6676_c0_g1_i2:343-807(+)
MPQSKDLSDHSMMLKSFLDENEDLLLYCNIAKPVQVQEVTQKQIYYESITKYTFYEVDGWKNRVILELPGIHKLPKENIVARFLDKGLEIKIHNLNNKNLMFAVPKTQVYLNPSECRYSLKENKMLITLSKKNERDSFFSLYAQRTWGGYDDAE